MDAEFWHKKWEDNEIGFHQSDVHPMLARCFGELGVKPGARVFVPLCGKTLDMAWLAGEGFQVVGAELSETAVQQFFEEAAIQPTITPWQGGNRYSAEGMEIFVGDVFELTAETLGPVDAIYDRAACVALPVGMRGRYASHVTAISGNAPHLMIVFTYDQQEMAGPPFSIPDEELRASYGEQYKLKKLCDEEVEGMLKGKVPAREKAWLLTAK